MNKKTLFRLAHIATDKNRTSDPGEYITDFDVWFTTQEVERKFREDAALQRDWLNDGLAGQYFLVVTAMKLVDSCPHCGEELDSEEREIL